MSHKLEDPELQKLEELRIQNENTLETINNDVKKRNDALLIYYAYKYIINKKRNEILEQERARLSEEGAYSEELLNQKVNKRLIRIYPSLVKYNRIKRESKVVTNLINLKKLQESIEKHITSFLKQGGEESELERLVKPESEEVYLQDVERHKEDDALYKEARKNVPNRTRFLSKFTRRRKGGKKTPNKKKTLKKRKMNKRK